MTNQTKMSAAQIVALHDEFAAEAAALERARLSAKSALGEARAKYADAAQRAESLSGLVLLGNRAAATDVSDGHARARAAFAEAQDALSSAQARVADASARAQRRVQGLGWASYADFLAAVDVARGAA